MRRLSLLAAAVLMFGGFAVSSIQSVQAAGPMSPQRVLPAEEAAQPLILTHSRKGKSPYWYYKKKRGSHVYRYDRRRHNHRHRHNDFGIYFGFNPYYYYYDPYYYDDPYYYPAVRRHNLSCSAVKRILRRQGYHSVRAYDCRGKNYGFYVRKNHKSYKVVVRARNGHIISRVRR